jgi:TetR/AcrR family transcriptional regulator, multidrug resistance operon repressor
MRLRDEDKITSIYNAAVKIINTDGFQGASMSKIAKEAQIAAATIYLYFDNKEDMINKLFLHLKHVKSKAYLKGNPVLTPTKETFRTIWYNHYHYIVENPQDFKFLENFTNCHLIDRINQQQAIGYYRLMLDLFELARQNNILKDLSDAILYEFLFTPIGNLLKFTISVNKTLSEKELETIFETSWSAISR